MTYLISTPNRYSRLIISISPQKRSPGHRYSSRNGPHRHTAPTHTTPTPAPHEHADDSKRAHSAQTKDITTLQKVLERPIVKTARRAV